MSCRTDLVSPIAFPIAFPIVFPGLAAAFNAVVDTPVKER